ncbi:MAG: HDOD domain-containing protein [Planctomycetota bacterium]|jgi:putative nucleotidyltransferase with HDIG domain
MKKEEILLSIQDLPPFPETVLKAIQAMKDPEISAKKIVGIIQYDQNITASILRFANSAYFGLKKKVTSLKHAVAYLGSKTILDMLMLSGALDQYRTEFTGYGDRGKEMLKHSFSTALMCRILGEKIGLQESFTVFSAGLLHDIGKVVLSSFVEHKFEEIIHLVNDHNYSLVNAEQEVLGLDHAQVGGEILKRWGLPEKITGPVTLHHQVEKADAADVHTPLVYLADQAYIVISGTKGTDAWSLAKMKKAMTRCRISVADLDDALRLMRNSSQRIQQLFEI